MNIIVALLNIVFLAGIIWVLQKKEHDLKLIFWPALVFKLSCGILLGVVYTYYYSIGDTFGFFNDGAVMARLARNDVSAYINFLWAGDESFPVWAEFSLLQPRSLFLSKIVSLVNLLTYDNYWITSLYFSLISFAASWKLVVTITRYFPDIRTAAVAAFLFFPSVVFWGSGIIKESVAITMLCYLSATFLRVWKKETIGWLEWIPVTLAVWVLWNLKYYFAAVFLPVIVTTYVTGCILIPWLKLRSWKVELLLWGCVFIVPLFVASFIHPNFYPDRILDVIVSNYQAFDFSSHPDDIIRFNNLEATGASILINAPWALVSGLFRPFLWESGNLFQLLAAGENLLLFILMITSARNIRLISVSPDRLLIVSLTVYSILLCVFITLSTPNFGTLSRYRIGYIPYFALLIMAGNPVIVKFENLMQRFANRLVR